VLQNLALARVRHFRCHPRRRLAWLSAPDASRERPADRCVGEYGKILEHATQSGWASQAADRRPRPWCAAGEGATSKSAAGQTVARSHAAGFRQAANV